MPPTPPPETAPLRGPPGSSQRPIHITLTPQTIALALAVGALGWIAVRLAPVFLVVITALFLVGTLNPAVAWLEAKNVRRGHALGIVFTALFLGVSGLLAVTLPTLLNQIMAFAEDAPALQAHLVERLGRSRMTAPLAATFRDLDYQDLLEGFSSTVLMYSTRSLEIFAYLVSAVFLALYFMIDRDRLRGGLYALVPRTHHIRLARVLLNLENIVGGYIRGQVLTSTLMAAFTFLLLLACGVKSALAIGVVAGVADVLPYVGVFLSVGPALAGAAAKGPGVVVFVLFAMLAYEELESRLLVPRIYGNLLKLPSSMVLLSLLIGTTLLGIVGALLALPVAAALRMLIEELRVELPGEIASDGKIEADDLRVEHEYERRVEGVPAEGAAAIAAELSDERAEEEQERAKEEAKERGEREPRP